jgi:nucleoside-diphosphate-sugar epimerase
MTSRVERQPAIVHVAATYPPDVCGIGDYTHLLVRHLADAGTPAEVWTHNGATRPDAAVRSVAARWDAAGVRSLLRAVRARRPHLIHFSSRHPFGGRTRA